MSWITSNDEYHYIPEIATTSSLEPVIYNVEQNPLSGEIYLVKHQDKFDFSYKIYNKDSQFVDRCVKTFKALPSNLGILLNGLQGTGKTVTAKLICNALNIPVIVQTKSIKGIESFLSKIGQDIVFFVDEYEKLYATRDNINDENSTSPTLLSVMDGVLNSNTNKTLFLFTTNSTDINRYLLNRPSRLRYIKEYDSLEIPVIIEIMEDLLDDKSKKNDLITYFSSLEFLTIDSVKTIIHELNIHGGEIKDFQDYYNLTKKEVHYNITNVEDKDDNFYYKVMNPDLPSMKDTPDFSQENWEYTNIYVAGRCLGEFVEIDFDKSIISVRKYISGGGSKVVKYSYEKLDYRKMAF